MIESQFINLRNVSFPAIQYSLLRDIPESFQKLPIERYVRFSDEVVEMNFRVIETYLPELLFLMSKDNQSLSKGIETLSKKKLYRTVQFTQRALTYKAFGFIEALFYADIFSRVWNGKLLTHRVYVDKQNGELEYYSMFDIRKLVTRMLDSLVIQHTESTLQISQIVK